MEEQALRVLQQGIDLATASGAFKSAKDVGSLNTALEILGNYFKMVKQNGQAKEAPAEVVEKPESKKTVKKA